MGGTFAVGGEGTDGSLNLVIGEGRKPEACDPTTCVDEGTIGWGAPGGIGLKPEASDPTTGPDDEKGIIFCGGATEKGVATGLAGGNCCRPGFSVPMEFYQ